MYLYTHFAQQASPLTGLEQGNQMGREELPQHHTHRAEK